MANLFFLRKEQATNYKQTYIRKKKHKKLSKRKTSDGKKREDSVRPGQKIETRVRARALLLEQNKETNNKKKEQ